MPALDPTERWAERSITPQQGATRAFDCCGYVTGAAAIGSVVNKFAIRTGAIHPEDPTMFVALGGVTARANEGPQTWIVTVTYVYLAQSKGQDADPLARPTRWQIVPSEISVSAELDRYKNLVGNSAGAAADPPFPRNVKVLEIIATRYFPNYSIAYGLQFMNGVNASDVPIKSLGTVPAESIMCTFIAPTSEIILEYPQPIEVVHKFQVRGPKISGDANDPAFRLRMIDKGFSGWYVGTSGATVQGDFSDPDPENSGRYRIRSSPTLLDGYGKPIDPNIKIGVNGMDPQRTPDKFLPRDTEVKRVGTGYAVALEFGEEQKVDFAQIIANL